jgi:hypothetical protein
VRQLGTTTCVLAPKGGQARPPELMSLAPDETVALGVAVGVLPDP